MVQVSWGEHLFKPFGAKLTAMPKMTRIQLKREKIGNTDQIDMEMGPVIAQTVKRDESPREIAIPAPKLDRFSGLI